MSGIFSTNQYTRARGVSKKSRATTGQASRPHLKRTQGLAPAQGKALLEKRRRMRGKGVALTSQLLRREISGVPESIECGRRGWYSTVERLLLLHRDRIPAAAVCRLGALLNQSEELKDEMLNGGLYLLGFPKPSTPEVPLPVIGYKEVLLDDLPMSSGSWRKRFEVSFMRLYFASGRLRAAPRLAVTGRELTCDVPLECTHLSLFQDEQELGLFFVYASPSAGSYNANEAANKAPVKEGTHSSGGRARLPNSTSNATDYMSPFLQIPSSAKEENASYQSLDHYYSQATTPQLRLSAKTHRESFLRLYEEEEHLLTVMASPYVYQCGEAAWEGLPLRTVHIRYRVRNGAPASYIPQLCQCSSPSEGTSWIVLNLQHSLCWITLHRPDSKSASVGEEESQQSLCLSLESSYASNQDLESFDDTAEDLCDMVPFAPERDDTGGRLLDLFYSPRRSRPVFSVRRVQKMDVERFLYENIAIYAPELAGYTINFATYVPARVKERVVLVQLLYEAMDTQQLGPRPNLVSKTRGGFLFSFDVSTGSVSMLLVISPSAVTTPESVDDWSLRMASETRRKAEYDGWSVSAEEPVTQHSQRLACVTKSKFPMPLTNASIVNASPLVNIPHPQYPLVLYNDIKR